MSAATFAQLCAAAVRAVLDAHRPVHRSRGRSGCHCGWNSPDQGTSDHYRAHIATLLGAGIAAMAWVIERGAPLPGWEEPALAAFAAAVRAGDTGDK